MFTSFLHNLNYSKYKVNPFHNVHTLVAASDHKIEDVQGHMQRHAAWTLCKNIWRQRCTNVKWHTQMHKDPDIHTYRWKLTQVACTNTCTYCAHKRARRHTQGHSITILFSLPLSHWDGISPGPPHTYTVCKSLTRSLGRTITVEVTLPKFQALWVDDSTIMHPCLLAKVTTYTHFHIHACYFQLKRSSAQQLFA